MTNEYFTSRQKHVLRNITASQLFDVIEFKIDGPDTYALTMSDRASHYNPKFPPPWIAGQAGDGSIFTFAENIVLDIETSYNDNKKPIYKTRLFPHYVCRGTHAVSVNDKFSKIEVKLSDMLDIYYDSDAFGYAFNSPEIMPSIAAAWESRVGRPLQFTDNPEIIFYTGKSIVTNSTIIFGEIVIHRLLSLACGNIGGNLTNNIVLILNFTEPKTLTAAVEPLMSLLRFHELIAGRRQFIDSLKITRENTNNDEFISQIEVYWPYQPAHDTRRSDKPLGPRDMPINGGLEPETFGSVLANWIRLDECRRDADIRFSDAFAQGQSYSIDRLISSSNMFDILPSDIFEGENLPPEITKARADATKIFKALPMSSERDSILSALGRIGSATLKRKIKQGAKVLTPSIQQRMPNLIAVLDEAVNLRNYYVHGSPTRIDYSLPTNASLITFYTDVLEFTFGVSALIDAGWNPDNWVNRGSSLRHPFKSTLASYKINFSAFNAARSAVNLSNI